MLRRSVTYLLLLFVIGITGYGFALPTARQHNRSIIAAFHQFQHPERKQIRSDLLVYNETTDEREEEDAADTDGTPSCTATFLHCLLSLGTPESISVLMAPLSSQSFRYLSVNRYLYNRVFRL